MWCAECVKNLSGLCLWLSCSEGEASETSTFIIVTQCGKLSLQLETFSMDHKMICFLLFISFQSTKVKTRDCAYFIFNLLVSNFWPNGNPQAEQIQCRTSANTTGPRSSSTSSPYSICLRNDMGCLQFLISSGSTIWGIDDNNLPSH